MKKYKPYRYFFISAGIMILCGCVRLLVDWFQYSSTLNSAPFTAWIQVVATLYGGAALLCAVTGLFLWSKEKRRKDNTL